MSDAIVAPNKKKKAVAISEKEVAKLGKQGKVSASSDLQMKKNSAAGPSCCIFIGGKQAGAAASNPAAAGKGAISK